MDFINSLIFIAKRLSFSNQNVKSSQALDVK